MWWALGGALTLLLLTWGGCAYAVATTPVRLAFLPDTAAPPPEVGAPKKSSRARDKAKKAACRAAEEGEAPSPLKLYDKEPQQLRTTGCNADHEPLPLKARWSVTPEQGPVQVSPNGLVTCSASGNAVLTAKPKGASVTPLEIPVNCVLVQRLDSNLPARLELSSPEARLETFALDEQGGKLPGLLVEAQSQEDTILEISGGKFVPRKEGTAKVTLRWSPEEGAKGLTREVEVQVFSAEGLVRSLRASYPERIPMGPSTHAFTVQPLGADGAVVPDVRVNLRSLDPSIVVAGDGILQAIAPGKARILASVGNVQTEVPIEVYERWRVNVTAKNPPSGPWDRGNDSGPDLVVRLQGAALRTSDGRTECSDTYSCVFQTETTGARGWLRFEISDNDAFGPELMGVVNCDLRANTPCKDANELITITLQPER